jgi:hypothetical protein
MTATMARRTGLRPPAIRKLDDRIVELVGMMATAFAPCTADHDRDDVVVAENIRELQASGSSQLTMQANLDGLGATLRQVCHIQAALARSGDSATRAGATRRFITLVTLYPQRRVADVGLVLTSSGGADGLSRREPQGKRPHDPK